MRQYKEYFRLNHKKFRTRSNKSIQKCSTGDFNLKPFKTLKYIIQKPDKTELQ